MSKRLRVLIVEDSPADVELLVRELERGGFELEYAQAQTAEAMKAELGKRKWEAVVSDYVMPGFDGLQALSILRQSGQDLPFIIVSGRIGEDIAVEAMRSGAHDYIMKNNLNRLVPAIERELAEADVRRARRLNEEMIDELASYPQRYPNPIVEINYGGSIHYINPSAKQLFPDLPVKGFGHPFLSGLEPEMEKLIKSGNKISEREVIISGTCYYQALYYIPENDTVRIYGLDVTSRKAAEEELKKAYEKLQATQSKLIQSAKMASIGKLAGGIVHQLNNPLSGILNNVQLLKMETADPGHVDFEAVKQLLKIVENSAIRCRDIIQSLLEISHVSEGVFQPVSLNELTDKVLLIAEKEIRIGYAELRKKFQPELPKINGDPQLLEQVLLIMLSNAKWAVEEKFRDKPGGWIEIETSADRDGKKVVLCVSDNGIGITAENRQRLFEDFFTTKGVGVGVGLGLALAAGIVEKHNGNISVASEPGSGAAFKITLPAL